jgi:hypothetical protein
MAAPELAALRCFHRRLSSIAMNRFCTHAVSVAARTAKGGAFAHVVVVRFDPPTLPWEFPVKGA